MNHYQLLGVAHNANMDQISRAYINLCKRHKPTISYGPEISFEMVHAAYKVLSDAESRLLYDASLVPKDSNLQKNTVPVSDSSESVVEGEWVTKDYSGVKEWVHDSRTPVKPSITAPVSEDAVPLLATGRAIRDNPKYSKARKTSPKGHKFLIVLLICFAFMGIPAGTGFFMTLGMQAAVAGSFSLLAACLFSIACLKTSPSASASGTKNAGKRRNYRAPNQKIYQNLTPAMRRNLMDADFALRCKIWGMPGVLDDAVEKFGQHNIDLGTAGEELTAKMLEELLKIPGTRIFHGLKFPGSKNADVDHVIVNGNKIVFIDSKMWVGAHYRWVRYDTIGRLRRKEFKEIHTNFPAAVVYLSQTFSKQQVKAMTIIHPNNHSRVSFDNSRASTVSLTNGQDAIREIGNWFSKDLTGMIDLDTMHKLEYQLK
jgi:hypothetical protein